jgi:hypothetical protein
MAIYATVDLNAFTDADFCQTFRQLTGTTYYDFTGCKMNLTIRRVAEDPLAELELHSIVGGYDGSLSAIFMYDPGGTGQPPGGLYEWLVFIQREDLQQLPEGDYVQSLIVTRPDGIYDDIWRGTFTNTIGPTR